MKTPKLMQLFVLMSVSWGSGGQAEVPTQAIKGEFTKIQLTEHFWAEGANAGDFNRDGKADVVYGPYWWAGPDFKQRHTYADDSKVSKVGAPGAETTIPGFKGALSQANDYSENFLAYCGDFNGDGWEDILILGFPGKESYWYENPQGKEGAWVRRVAIAVTDGESPTLTDLTGDGRPEIVCFSGGQVGYAEFDLKKPEAAWSWHPISEKGKWQRFTHGLGVGDVNGDGRMDVMDKDGWWEQPAALTAAPWPRHEALFGPGGAQMFAYDVNGDGLPDVITSLEAHGYGVVWFEQTRSGEEVGWIKHVIVGSKAEENEQGVVFSQPHALDLVDMNGDGLKDIITGKRFWAHGPKGDKEPNAAPVLYWFELQRQGKQAKFVAHEIDDLSGVGTQVVATDLNADRKPDVIVGNKRGAFVFLRK